VSKFDKFRGEFGKFRGKADEISWLTAVTQLNFRGLIKS